MRFNKVFFGLLGCFVLVTLSVGLGGAALADESRKATEVKSSSNPATWKDEWPVEIERHKRPTISDLKADLDQSDFLAALKALNIALNEVGDGSTFVWRRKDHNLKGAIKPTSAFRSADGRICRHIVFALSIGGYVKSIESIACRSTQGTWVIDG